MRARDVLGPGGPLDRGLSGYELREGQLTMADAVEDVLRSDGVALIEAGTGTGKTLAYLAPAVLSGRKVIVSTGTKTLQDQIVAHDLPLLEAHLGAPIEAAALKGLGNYVCRTRLEALRAAGAPEPRALATLEAWLHEGGTGERSELAALAEDDPLWSHVLASADTRIGPRCTHYEACFVTAARRRADEAQIVVVNHHLYFADLALRSPYAQGILPEHDAVIFDEAHQVEDVATQFFGVEVSSVGVERLARDAEAALDRAEGARRALARRAPRELVATADAFFDAIPVRAPEDGGRLALPRAVLTGEVERRYFALDGALEALEAELRAAGARDEVCAAVLRRASRLREALSTIAAGGAGSHVTWCESHGRRMVLGASPVDLRETFRRELFDRLRAVVFTSATLTTGGTFRHFKNRLGIDDEVSEITVHSPFDFSRQAALYVPPELPDPREPGFVDAAANEVLRLVALTGGGAFVLSTSHRMMRGLYERCRGRLPCPTLVQGEAPKPALLERFRDAGDAVLFATSSFWEGVDVPGSALRLVIVDKLPFDVPTDPLVAARSARLEEAGESAFMSYLVPSAALALKQGFGRLIRTRRDRGVVAVLDRRLVTKGYGKTFLRTLPPARRCDRFEEVASFWNDAPSPTPPDRPGLHAGDDRRGAV